MTPTCAILISSRQRVDGMFRAIESFLALHDNLEICVRLDDDDKKSLDMIPRLQLVGCKVFTGPRYDGYSSLGRFLTELSHITDCQWLWPFDDDAYVEGEPFTGQLLDIPTTGVYVLPTLYCLGASNYADFYQYPIVPKGCWTPFSEIQNPPDAFFRKHLVFERGWEMHHLQDIIVRHMRTGHDHRT